MTITTTFPETEFSLSRVEAEAASHADQAPGLARADAYLVTEGGVCTLTTRWV